MPVGRFVLDVHGESRSTWPASDNVCAVLQIINHLQDCVKDYRALDRVYIPLDALAAAGSSVEALDAPRATPQLLACLHGLADRTGAMLEAGQRPAGADRRPPACGWRSPPSSRWRGISCSCCGAATR